MVEAGPGGWSVPAVVPPDVAASLPEAITAAEAALQPATPREAAVVLVRLAAHYWHPDRPPEHHRLVYEDLLHDVAAYPLAVLVAAADEWRRSQRWAPRPCDLTAACERIARQRRVEVLRLRYLALALERHGGRCPRVMRRIGDRLVDYGDPLHDHMLEAALRGRTTFPGDLVVVAPGTPLGPPPVDPVIVAHRERVRTILGDAGYSALERLRLGDMSEERAEALAAERVVERDRQAQRGRVLRILLTAGITIPEIEASRLLEMPEAEARALAEELLRGASVAVEAEAVAPAQGTVK